MGGRLAGRAGEYRMRAKCEEGGAVVYSGEADKFGRRLNEHMRRGKLKDAAPGSCVVEYKEADGRSTSRTRREHERRKIAQHSPALNLSRGGEGCPAKNTARRCALLRPGPPQARRRAYSPHRLHRLI